MKITSKILLALLFIFLAGIHLSNMALKSKYDTIDKADTYWTYDKVLEQPFKFLKITGGNVSNIAFEQSAKPSVRILTEWRKYHNGQIKARVVNDTLYIDFNFRPIDLGEKYWLESITAVRIFSPELLSVDGVDTKFEMNRMRQKSLVVNLSGRSRFELESMIPDLDTLRISGRDSSQVIVEMAPEYQSPGNIIRQNSFHLKNETAGTVLQAFLPAESNEAMAIKNVTAFLQGYTVLDIGHAQIQQLQLTVADSSAIVLSGQALKKVQ